MKSLFSSLKSGSISCILRFKIISRRVRSQFEIIPGFLTSLFNFLIGFRIPFAFVNFVQKKRFQKRVTKSAIWPSLSRKRPRKFSLLLVKKRSSFGCSINHLHQLPLRRPSIQCPASSNAFRLLGGLKNCVHLWLKNFPFGSAVRSPPSHFVWFVYFVVENRIPVAPRRTTPLPLLAPA